MGKRKRAEFQYHDALSKAVVNNRLAEIDPIIEGRKFLSLMKRRAGIFSRCPILENNTNVDDHISVLPDDVLQFIISLLTMRKAASISILSTRWRNLWRNYSCLNFDFVNMIGNHYPKNKFRDRRFLSKVRSKFVNWIDKILQLRQGAKIDTLRVCFHLGKESTSSIDRWMELASAQGVRELVLVLNLIRYGFGHEYKKQYQFPHEVFAHGYGSSLIYLHLEACIFRLPQEYKGFNSLLSLTVGCTWLTRQDVIHILSNCSVLEWLSIRNCYFCGSTYLNFAGPSLHLKHLSVLGCTNLVGIEVEAVSLVSFEYRGPVVRLSFKNVSKAVRVHIGFPFDVNLDGVRYALSELPSTFPLLETLFLGRYHWFYRKENILPAKLPTFTNLKRLVLCCQTVRTKNLLELTSFLEACPLLQKLELNLCVYWRSSEYLQTEKLAEEMQKQGSSHNNLKEIDIYGFKGYDNEIELTKCLLKIATALQKMEIYTDIPRLYCGNGQWYPLRRLDRPAGLPIKKVHKLLRKEVRSTTRLIIQSP